jgi:hypothetical protein
VNHQELGEDERTTPHIERVVRLLVAQHPDYGEIRIQDGAWAWAHKVRRDRKTLTIDETYRPTPTRHWCVACSAGPLTSPAWVNSMGGEPGEPRAGWTRRPHHPRSHGSGRAFAPGPRDRRRGSP